ncbi:MAG: chain-length determining protein [Candidatus Tectimicrobiota bacterium]|nr:MAG: chain-length determining protein [Candidatus Tectomicrobia bacterium]
MNPNGKALALPLQQSTFGIQDYLEIFWRRKWWLVVPLLLGTVIAVVYSYTLPPLYRSSTLILVEPQEVPPSYVSSLVTSSVEERLATIRQQVMSRTNLEKIIREFGLYREPQAQPVSRGLMGRVRTKAKRLLQSLGLYREPPTVVPERGHIPEEVIARMRSSIEVEVLGGRRSGHNAFTISFRGENPQTVMQVTNALASLFIEENLKVRERQAEGTAEFLESQLREAARDLQRQEQALKEFKERHRGALPEQLDANLRTLDRLQQELQSLNEALRTAEEQALLLERQLAELQQAETPQASAPEAPAVPLERELQQLRGQLALLQAQFNDNYPDILILKRRIAELEAQRGTVPEAPSGGEPAPAASSPRGAQQLELQLHALRSDIAALTARRQQVQALIREYERRVEETPDNELKLLTLTRNYAISQKNYETLLAKRLNAKLAESLEKRQKGEQFRILDPANLPTRPYWPDRPRIVLAGQPAQRRPGGGVHHRARAAPAPAAQARRLAARGRGARVGCHSPRPVHAQGLPPGGSRRPRGPHHRAVPPALRPPRRLEARQRPPGVCHLQCRARRRQNRHRPQPGGGHGQGLWPEDPAP